MVRKKPTEKSMSNRGKIDKELLQKLAEIIAPEEWARFHANKGVVTNEDGWALQDSYHIARRIIDSDILEKEKSGK